MNYIPYDGNEKIRIVFLYQVPSFWPSWESLYQTLLRDSRFDVRLVYLHVEDKNKAQTGTAKQFLDENGLTYEDYSYKEIIAFRPHYMLFQTPYDKGHRNPEQWSFRFQRQGIRIVYIPYGIEIPDTRKAWYKHFSLEVVVNADLIYVLSDDMKKEYEKHSFNAKAVRVTGLPRFDLLTDKTRFALPKEIADKCGGRKIIMWKAPFPRFFRQDGEMRQAEPRLGECIKFIDYIRKRTDLFFIFIPHPGYFDNTINEDLRPLAAEMIRRLSETENVFISRNHDYRIFLMNAAAIMTDGSVAMVEAGAADVPVMYLHTLDHSDPMTAPIQGIADSYYQGATAKDMEEFVDMAVNGTDRKANERKLAFCRCVPFFGEQSCERIRDNLIDELDNIKIGPDRRIGENRTRIILFGTGDMWEYCRNQLQERLLYINFVAVVDNKKKMHNTITTDILDNGPVLVRGPEDINSIKYDYILIASNLYFEDICRQLTEGFGVGQNKILPFDRFIVAHLFKD